jgi:hypothetical protein
LDRKSAGNWCAVPSHKNQPLHLSSCSRHDSARCNLRARGAMPPAPTCRGPIAITPCRRWHLLPHADPTGQWQRCAGGWSSRRLGTRRHAARAKRNADAQARARVARGLRRSARARLFTRRLDGMRRIGVGPVDTPLTTPLPSDDHPGRPGRLGARAPPSHRASRPRVPHTQTWCDNSVIVFARKYYRSVHI